MAGYDSGVFEGDPSHGEADTSRMEEEAERRRARDPNGAWNAVGVEGGASVSKQFDHDYARYRRLGEAATRGGPVTLDQSDAAWSRGMQMGGLDLLRRQADGSAASAADIVSQRANQNAARAAASQVAGSRGVGASLAAFGGANEAAAQGALAANARNAGMRADEISRGQGAFTAGAGRVRAGDLNIATQDAQLDAQNRALQDKQQQFYERMAWDTRNAEMNAANEAMYGEQARMAQQRQARLAESQADWQKTKDVASLGLGTLTSDPRAKMHMGSLSSLMRGR